MDFFSTEGSCHLLASWIGFIPLSPHRDRGWLDVHIWPRGRSPRRSLFNNTVPGLSWLGWWAQPPPATLSTLIHAVTTGHRSIINTNKNTNTIVATKVMVTHNAFWHHYCHKTTAPQQLHWYCQHYDFNHFYSCSCYPQRITTNSFLRVVMHYLKGQILLLSLTSSILVTLKVIKDCLLRSLLTPCTVSLSLSRVYLSEVYFPLPLTGLGSTQFLGFPIRG